MFTEKDFNNLLKIVFLITIGYAVFMGSIFIISEYFIKDLFPDKSIGLQIEISMYISIFVVIIYLILTFLLRFIIIKYRPFYKSFLLLKLSFLYLSKSYYFMIIGFINIGKLIGKLFSYIKYLLKLCLVICLSPLILITKVSENKESN